MPKSTASKARQWCFTIFWDGEEPGAKLFEKWDYEYIYVGKETCPDTQRLHYQGYVRFANPRALGGMKKLHGTAHWEACKGSEEENVRYCSKDDDLIIEQGDRQAPEKKTPGKRSDIIAVREMVRNGANMRQICLEAKGYQSLRGGEILLKYLERQRDHYTKVIWIYGNAGLGKSRIVRALTGTEAYWCGSTDKWFEGYDAHDDAIIDDFSSGWCTYKRFLHLTDRYPHRVEFKGGSRQWLAKRIFITCDKPPHEIAHDWGAVKDNDLKQIGRRIETIYYMSPDGKTYGAPGSTIGIEPSVEKMFPEQSPEQEVGGNTTDPSTPIYSEGQGPTPTYLENVDDLERLVMELLTEC